MPTTIAAVSHVTDAVLLTELTRAATQERFATAHLIALLAELDTRRLYLGEGCSSLFTYCTQVLHLSEHAAYGRIEAARAARRCPAILDLLAEGAVTLTTITLLASHLTDANANDVLRAARHKSKREVERLVAALHPLPPVASSVRKLPAPKRASGSTESDRETPIPGTDPEPTVRSYPPVSPRPAVVAPLAPERYKVQVTVSRETHDKLRRAQELLRHVVPDGDPAAIVDRALTLLVAELERSRLAATTRPRPSREATPGSRHVPAAVKREVWSRDEGQCAFVGAQGRCTERGFLEVHHVVPFAAGGRTTAENCALRCRAHNTYEAEQFFGPSLVREERCGYGAARSGPSMSQAAGTNPRIGHSPEGRDHVHAQARGCRWRSSGTNGATVRTAASAAEAIDTLRSVPVQVLLSDIAMPGEDGYSLIRQVRALAATAASQVPAVALTSLAREEDRAAALRAGFQMHFAKPVDGPALVEAVAALAAGGG